jgi:hypothetical protein
MKKIKCSESAPDALNINLLVAKLLKSCKYLCVGPLQRRGIELDEECNIKEFPLLNAAYESNGKF